MQPTSQSERAPEGETINNSPSVQKEKKTEEEKSRCTDGDGDAQREQLFLTQGSFSDIWVFYILKDWSLFWKETHRKVWLKFGEHKTFDISLRKDEES